MCGFRHLLQCKWDMHSLEFYVAQNGSFVDVSVLLTGPIFTGQAVQDPCPLKMGPIDCPKTSVPNYHSTLHKIPKEHRSQNTCVIIFIILYNQLCPARMQWNHSPESDISFLPAVVFYCTHSGVASPRNCVIIHTALSFCVKHLYTKWGLFSIGKELTMVIDTRAGVSHLICFLRHSVISSYVSRMIHV